MKKVTGKNYLYTQTRKRASLQTSKQTDKHANK